MRSFTIFPDLPAEIRRLIWQECLPGPRIVQVNYSSCLQRYISNCQPPIVLHINRESRAEASMRYRCLRIGHRENHEVYVDLSIDTVYLNGIAHLRHYYLQPFLYELATSPDRHIIRQLAVDQRAWNDLCENGWMALLCKMNGLEEITMVIEFGRDFKGEIGFLRVPDWRRDLLFLESSAKRGLIEQGGRIHDKDWRAPTVKCVIMTRGGEQA